jgi:hypothetical protein
MHCDFDGHCWNSGAGPAGDAPLGAACAYDQACQTGICRDGVCCSTTCTDACMTCADPTSLGTCVAIADGATVSAEHMVCPTDQSCHSGGCSFKLNGTACDHNSECMSARCVDGVCCGSTCAACQVCNSEGTCEFAPAKTDPHGDCLLSTGDSLCMPTCDGKGACALPSGTCMSGCAADPPSSTPVFQQANARQEVLVCSSAGRCETPLMQTACNADACVAGMCTSSCTSDFDCSKHYYCHVSGFCVSAGGTTTACTRDAQCQSGYCDATMHCSDCDTNADCKGTGYCNAGACTDATLCAQLDCPGNGFGDSCTTTGGANVLCGTSVPSGCTNPRAPIDTSGVCTCGMTACGVGEVCSTKNGAASPHCLGVAGRPCYDGSVCASGQCNNHVCGTGAVGTPCFQGADCTSTTCTNGSCG